MRVSNLLKPYLYRCLRKRTCGMALSIYNDTFFGTVPLLTFSVPLSFSTPDPVTGEVHCTNAMMMDPVQVLTALDPKQV